MQSGHSGRMSQIFTLSSIKFIKKSNYETMVEKKWKKTSSTKNFAKSGGWCVPNGHMKRLYWFEWSFSQFRIGQIMLKFLVATEKQKSRIRTAKITIAGKSIEFQTIVIF